MAASVKNTTTSGTPKALIDFLSSPASYSFTSSGEIRHIQTHISHVFIVPPYVFKIKKPVNLDFLDFSSLDKRKKYCRQEIKLNRRLCSDIYLDVIPIFKKGNSFCFNSKENEATIAEYAVKMKQLQADQFLHKIVENEQLNQGQIDRVAQKLADFYTNQKPDKKILESGRIENIKVNTDENFQQTTSFIGETIDEITFNTIKKFTNEYYSVNQSLFEKRLKQKRMVDGHGDLHLEHIHLAPEQVCIYDCIEFNERLRHLDLAADLAFLAMDLDYNGLPSQSRYFIKTMSDKLNDEGLLQIVDFYKCYRAYVRGKVESMTGSKEEVSAENRSEAIRQAERYFKLALKYSLLGSQPTVLVFMGPIAGGKTTLAKRISQKLSITHVSSDEIRKELVGQPLKKRTPASERDQLYSTEMSEKTYHQLFKHTKKHIQQYESVILDATFSRQKYRAALKKELKPLDATVYFIEAHAPKAVLKKRLKKREQQDAIISDARLEDFEKLYQKYEPPEELKDKQLTRIDTNDTPDDTLKLLFNHLMKKHLKKV